MEALSQNRQRTKEELIAILDREADLVDFVTRVPVTIGQLLFAPRHRELYYQLVEMARNAEPMGPFESKRLGFTRKLDKMYDNGNKVPGTYWVQFKTEIFKSGIGREDEAYNILVQSGEFPELAERYER